MMTTRTDATQTKKMPTRSDAPETKNAHLWIFAAIGLLVLAACNPRDLISGEGAANPAANPQGGEVAAIIDGRKVSIDEVHQHIQGQFLKEFLKQPEERQFEMNENAIRELVRNHIVETEARQQGKTSQALLDEISAVPDPTAQDISDWFTANQDRLRGAKLENVTAQITELVLKERREKAMSDFIDPKLAALSWEIVLTPKRKEVGATRLARGAADAPITIITFSDYQCPYCVRAEPILNGVLERYPDRVRLVHRHFPLDTIHPFARSAAEASMCADEQGKFWAYHDGIFARAGQLEGDALTEIGSEVGLDAEAFNLCVEERRFKDFVAKDFADGREAGVSGTPSFFLNGIKLKGARSVEDLSAQVDIELARLNLDSEDSTTPEAASGAEADPASATAQ